MNRNRLKKGFTLAEVLITVAIITVVAAIAIVFSTSYIRALTKLEYDGYAKELFVAAQNHLSASGSQGFLGRSDFGTKEAPIDGIAGSGDGVYYFVMSSGYSDVNDENSVLNLMLPRAAVDETVRIGGDYIVRYHKDSGRVLDVFYWSSSGGRYDHTYSDADYKTFMLERGDPDALRNYGADHSVIGYYGGASAESLTYGQKLLTPTVIVKNAEKLTVTVTDPNRNTDGSKNNENAKLKLVVTGVTSKNTREIPLAPGEYSDFCKLGDISNNAQGNYVFNIVLDDITVNGRHFCELFTGGLSGDLIPGEDITVHAVSYNNTQLTNVAESSVQITNSLFAYNALGDGKAHISNVRHLENLDEDVSKLASGNTALPYVTSSGSKTVVSARQTGDIAWNGFTAGYIYGSGVIGYGDSRLTKETGTFYPVSPKHVLAYSGGGYTISGLTVKSDDKAGLFGSLEGGSVSDIKLSGLNVIGTDAGALAGSAKGTAISNVLAVSSGSAVSVSGTGSTGGLIGSMDGGSVERSAAALVVASSGGNAGGLIGTSQNGALIKGCFSGGHTVDGWYTGNFNVTAASCAGGLIGNADKTTAENCYSTCSAFGSTAGGFVGTASSGTLSGCYSAGLTTGAEKGAFAGSLSGVSVSGCRYYETVNEIGAPATGYTYLSAVGSGSGAGISPFDADAENFNGFIGSDRRAAVSYDEKLNAYYHGKYGLVTVSQLGAAVNAGDFVSAHYGDWPSPEVRIINIK